MSINQFFSLFNLNSHQKGYEYVWVCKEPQLTIECWNLKWNLINKLWLPPRALSVSDAIYIKAALNECRKTFSQTLKWNFVVFFCFSICWLMVLTEKNDNMRGLCVLHLITTTPTATKRIEKNIGLVCVHSHYQNFYRIRNLFLRVLRVSNK